MGVWNFNSPIIPNLKGPENDLGAMETLIRAEGSTDVTVLRNDQVTRTTVETALHALGLRSKPGDWIFVYYSGHGAEAEAAVKGTSDGDYDQFLPLASFDPDKQDPERFIVDKDFYAWMARYIPKSVQIFMIADACHSGTLNRSIDPRAFHFTPRLAFRGDQVAFELTSRPSPRFPGVLDAQEPTPGASLERADLSNMVYIGAAQDDQLALEASLPVEGAPSRGLLTYSFEQGLTSVGADGKTLAADLDGDGKVTLDELATYLNSQVRTLTGQRQDSAAHIPVGKAKLVLFAALPAPPSPQPGPALPGVFAIGGAALATADGAVWRAAADREGADFVWDRASGAVLRRSGDVVAEHVATVDALTGVVTKWNAMEALRPLLSEENARIRVGPKANGARYAAGTKVTLTLEQKPGGAPRYLTMFDLASDGTVQLLYPLASDGAGKLDGKSKLEPIENQVVAPFGADHVVAVVTPTEPQALRAALRGADNQRAADRLVEPIRQALAAGRGQAALSIGELYTGN